MPTIRRTRELLDPSIAIAAEGSQDPADHEPAPPPILRAGNQNARTHGLYSADPPDPESARIAILRDIDLALLRGDHRALMRSARALAHLGDRDIASIIRANARTMKDAEARARRERVPFRRERIPRPTERLRQWLQDRKEALDYRDINEKIADLEDSIVRKEAKRKAHAK